MILINNQQDISGMSDRERERSEKEKNVSG